MVTADQIRRDLKNIRYYYARREIFDAAKAEVGGLLFLPVVQKYNQTIREASPRLYDLYISLYLNNKTQRELADKMCVSPEYVQVLHRNLIQFFQEHLPKEIGN